MTSLAIGRLSEERKSWRKDHPSGFFAKPLKKPDNSMDLLKWETQIPGVAGTDWEGGLYKMNMEFPPDYPARPPICTFTPPLFHPNLFSCGRVCLSIVNEGEDWSASITIKQVLLGIQDMLDNPNPKSPAQLAAYECFVQNRSQYKSRVRQQALRNVPDT